MEQWGGGLERCLIKWQLMALGAGTAGGAALEGEARLVHVKSHMASLQLQECYGCLQQWAL